MKKTRFKKHEDVSLYRIAKLFLNNLRDDEITDRANGVAFNFILAIFPAIIFLFTLIPYVTAYFPEINRDSIMGFFRDDLMMPESMYEAVSTTILDIVSNQRGGLLTFGFLFAMYLSTNGMMALMRAFNACYKTVENRKGWKTRMIATLLTLNMTFVLFLAILLLIIGQFVLDYFLNHMREFDLVNFDDYTVYLILPLRFLIIFIVFFLAISTIYYFGPAIHYNWRFFSIGSLIATLLCLGVSYGFSYYITNFGAYNKVYGSIGVLIALMVWIQLITMVLLFGYEINASIHEAIRSEALWKARKYRMKQQVRQV
ncbi:YihY/virulence factor BrkB family protein [Fulvivirgaceae bacterium PWU4]|uniref:YihY/virulence factor BrkB family protein n=1 Tax=Chryseosolibacter histidini TaxID=2782349 RepID=A0AAP2DL89_9BACT|nr:YihY/virulence factor BrkB family protein [Chryseosolibacter histidini]MBT1697217.1 YihY/virulence factor BrkB family protein [Chryseosolibacter histidini]